MAHPPTHHAGPPEGPCCASCHFYWEEENVFPLLPEAVRAQLQREHDAIRRQGFPPHLVDQHGDRELEVMRIHCSAEVCVMIERDHVCLEGLRCES